MVFTYSVCYLKKWIIIGAAVLATWYGYGFTSQPAGLKSTAEIVTGLLYQEMI